ncbi:MAG: nickel-responsive transcriptional regulator NikR [Synergistetes bacterium]|nr:nickel-responsive transcriptional regulator NikR [Synergistota bacterium]
MKDIVRFSVSVDWELLEKFDTIIGELGYESRSKAVADLLYSFITSQTAENSDVNGIFVFIVLFDHHTREIREFYHHHLERIVSTLHIHVDADRCLEISVLKGNLDEVKKMTSKIGGMKGVLYSKFVPVVLDDG